MEAQTAIVKFLKDYISVYDSDNRSSLAGAYHDSALFSLSTAYNSAVQYRYIITVNAQYLKVVGTIFYKFKVPEVQINLHFG